MKINSQFFPSIIKTFGSSMYPLLIDQDIVYLKKVRFERIKVTDVICIKKKGKIFTHRVIYKTPKYLITKGDANIESDGRILPGQIIGRVAKIKRGEQIVDIENLYLFQATCYFDEISKITGRFKEKNIDYVLLKGLPLDLYYAKKHPSRIYSDCDILINPKNRKKAHKILENLDFKAESQKRLSHLQRYIGADVKELNYCKKISNFIVRFDIHYEINVFSHITKLPFPFLQKISDSFAREMMKNKEYVEINDIKLPILKYDDLIIYLLLHTFGHGYTGALRLEAIKNLLTTTEYSVTPNLHNILEKANSYKIINFITPPIYLLHKYYKIQEPYDILKKKFSHKLNYSLLIYGLLSRDEQLFDDMTATYSARFKRALFLFFLSEANIFKKLYYVLQPKLVLHLIFFVLIYLEMKLRKNSFMNAD